jgi:hypothetical protein
MMKTSDSITELATALSAAQAVMTAAKKDAVNPFFKSKYADLGSVIYALKDGFAANGLSFVQIPELLDAGVSVTTRIMHKSGEYIEGTLVLPLTKMDAQAVGSAISYARRYALQSMAGIPAEDSDAEVAMGRMPSVITQAQAVELNSLLKATNANITAFLSCFGASSVESLPAASFGKALAMLQSKLAKQEAAKSE